MQKGKAECIYAHYFLKDTSELNFYEKLERFEKLNALNKRAATNTLHVSLNFDPSEKLSKAKLISIAQSYMDICRTSMEKWYHHTNYRPGKRRMDKRSCGLVLTNIC